MGEQANIYAKLTYAFLKLIKFPSTNNEMMLNSITAPKRL